MYRSSSPGLAGKKWQKTSSMSSKMIVVFPVPPAPIKRHACCVRFRKGVLFSSSCNATSIASANHLQADNCSGANLNPEEDFSNAATFRAIAADGLLRVRHSASGPLASLSAAGSTASFPPESVAARPADKRLRPIPSLVMAARCASSSVWVIIGVFSFNLICSSRGFAEDEPLFLCSSTVLCKVSSSAVKGNKPAEIMSLTNLVCFWRWKIMACKRCDGVSWWWTFNGASEALSRTSPSISGSNASSKAGSKDSSPVPVVPTPSRCSPASSFASASKAYDLVFGAALARP